MSQFSLFCDEQKNHLLGKKLNHSALWVANLSYITGFQGLICLSKIILNFRHWSVEILSQFSLFCDEQKNHLYQQIRKENKLWCTLGS